jgi:hypothetical protein
MNPLCSTMILDNCLLTHRMKAITFKDHTKNIGIWGSFLTVSLIVYFSLSSGDFSFLLVSLDSITMIKSEGDGLILCNQNAHSGRVSKLPSSPTHSSFRLILHSCDALDLVYLTSKCGQVGARKGFR